MASSDLNFNINIETNDSSAQIKDVQEQLYKLAKGLDAFKAQTSQIAPVTGMVVDSINRLSAEAKQSSISMERAISSYKSAGKIFRKLFKDTKVTAVSIEDLNKQYAKSSGSIASAEKAIAELTLKYKDNNAALYEAEILLEEHEKAVEELLKSSDKETGALTEKQKELQRARDTYKEFTKDIKVQNNAIRNTTDHLREDIKQMKKHESVMKSLAREAKKNQALIDKEQLKEEANARKEVLAQAKKDNKEYEAIAKANAKAEKEASRQIIKAQRDREKAFIARVKRKAAMEKKEFSYDVQEKQLNSLTKSLTDADKLYKQHDATKKVTAKTSKEIVKGYEQQITTIKGAKAALAELNAEYKANSAALKTVKYTTGSPTAAAATASKPQFTDQYAAGMTEKKKALADLTTGVKNYEDGLRSQNVELRKAQDSIKSHIAVLEQNIAEKKAQAKAEEEELKVRAQAKLSEEIADQERLTKAVKAHTERVKAQQKAIRQRNRDWYQASIVMRQIGTALTRSITAPLVAAAVASAKYTAEIEMQQKAFGILLNDMSKGMELYEEVITYAAKTPYQIPELSQATKELLAFGSSSDKVMDQLRRLGDIAQNDSEKLDSVVKAFGKVEARGTAHMRELNRFVMAGVPIFEELQKVLDMDSEQFMKAVRLGQVSFSAVEQAVKNMTNEGGKFYDMSETLSQTVAGRFSTLKDEVALAGRSFVEDFMPEIKKVINYVIDYAQALQLMSKEGKTAILNTLKFAAAIGPVLLGLSKFIVLSTQIAKLLPSIATGISGVMSAMGMSGAAGVAGKAALWTAAGSGPVGWAAAIVAGLALVAGAFLKYKIEKQVKEVTDAFRDLQGELASFDTSTSIVSVRTHFKLRFEEMTGDQLPASILTELLSDEVIESALKNDSIEELNSVFVLRTQEYQKLQSRIKELSDIKDSVLEDMLRESFKNNKYIDTSAMSFDASAWDTNLNRMRVYIDMLPELKDAYEELVSKKVLAETGEDLETFKAALEDLQDKFLGVEKKDLRKLTLMQQLQKNLIGSVDPKTAATDIDGVATAFSAFIDTTYTSTSEQLLATINAMPDRNMLRAVMNKIIGGVSAEEIKKEFGEDKWVMLLVTTFEKVAKELGDADLITSSKTIFPIINTLNSLFDFIDKAIEDDQNKLLENIQKSHYMDNLSDVLFGTLTGDMGNETIKAKLESNIEGIEETISAFIDKNWDAAYTKAAASNKDGVASITDTFAVLKEWLGEQMPTVFEEYEKDIDKLKKVEADISFEKTASALRDTVAGYRDTAEAIAETTYKAEGYSDAQIKTLVHLNKTITALKAVKALTSKAVIGIDATGLTAAFDLLNEAPADAKDIEGIPIDTFKADAKEASVLYFKEFYSLSAAEQAQKRITDAHREFTAALVNEYGVEGTLDIASLGAETLKDDIVTNFLDSVNNANKTAAEIAIDALESLRDSSKLSNEVIDEAINKVKSADWEQTLENMSSITGKFFGDSIGAVGKALGLSGEDLNDFALAMDSVFTGLETAALQALVDEFYNLGEAIGSSSLSADNFTDSLKNIGKAIMDALPNLLLQAGIQLLTPETWPIGLGLIAASGIVSLANGFLAGRESETETSGGTLSSSSISFSANGNAFDRGSLISVPTAFKTSKGINIGGEAGTEAIMPLTRGANGKLGVQASGSGSISVPVNIQVINQTGVEVETEQRRTTGSDGSQNIEMVIKKVVTRQLNNGEYDRTMQSRYGSRAKGVV